VKTLPYAVTLCLFATTLFTACKKQEQQISQLSILPPATRMGANNFGALVNGLAYIPYDSGGLFTPSQKYNVMFDSHSLLIGTSRKVAHNSDHYYYDLSIQADSISLKQDTTYVLGNASTDRCTGSYSVIDDSRNSGDTQYSTDATHKGTLRIDSIDHVKNFISGTFSFDAVNAKGNIVHVTNGRFDLKIQ
jgi:hypothetical protein